MEYTMGFIPLGSKVTVYHEMAREEVNMDSFWRVIAGVTQVDDDIYKVTGVQGNTHTIMRSLLRLCK